MKRRLLVTGGAGFIGSHFVEHCLAHRLVDRIVVLDALTYAGDPANLDAVISAPQIRFVKGDICNGGLVTALLRDEALEGIVNFAAESSVDRSIQGPGAFQRTNVEGVMSLLEAARGVWCADGGSDHRFHQISTDEVFGPGPEDGALRNESMPYAPGSPYAATKAAADHLVLAWQNTYGLRVSVTYSSNVYGPRQQPEKLIPLAIRNLLAGKSVPVYGNGLQRRNWIFVRDVCRALVSFLAADTEGKRLYLGSELEFTNLDLLETLAALAGRAFEGAVQFVADRPGHDRRYGLSSEAFRRLTGFSEQTDWNEGLVETLNWYRERRATASFQG